MKLKRHKNPLLQKKYEEGFALGLRHGTETSVNYFSEKFEGLRDVEGIGKKTIEKIRDHFGKEYFEEVSDE